MLSPDDVFKVSHYVMQFGVENAELKYVVSNDISAIQAFIKQHNLPKELMKGIEKVEPNERKNSEYDVIQIFNMKSNKDNKIYKVYTTDRIAKACGSLAQLIMCNDILFGYAILENGYEFINRIIEDVQKLTWGIVPEYEMLSDCESYATYENPCAEYYNLNDFYEILLSSIDPHLRFIPISLEGYVKTFRYLMEHVDEQFDHVPC